MTLAHAVILGTVQGLTEFLPVSSSGHLVILQAAFGIREPQLAFDVFLHFATLIAVIIFFRRDIVRLCTADRRVLGLLVLASIPAFLVGFFCRDAIEALFASPRMVGYMLLVTGAWLLAVTVLSKRRDRPGHRAGRGVSALTAFGVGVAQACAIIPGISRSGATIGAGIMAGMGKEEAFRFAFLLAIPVIGGATLLKAVSIGSALAHGGVAAYLAGGVCALAAGLASIAVLRRAVVGNQLHLFGIYCIIMGSIVIFFIG